MKKMLLAATFAALFTPQAAALFTFTPQANNTVGLYLGGQLWQSEASGIFDEKNALIDFHLKKEQQSNYFIAIEHPYPLLPNVRISRTTLDTTGKNNLTQEFSFGDESFTIGDVLDASFNVSYVDYTLYYELFDNGIFSFDFGLTARDFNGAITVTAGVTSTHDEDCHGEEPVVCIITTTDPVTPMGKIKTNDIEPMLYLATNIRLPLTALNVFAQGDVLLIDDHSLYDYQIGLSYELIDSRRVGFSMTLGYRVVKMAFENLDSLYTDLEFKGAFVGVIVRF